MNKQELLKLAERVEAGGTLNSREVAMCFGGDDPITLRLVGDATTGSLDAAQALHDAVLPGWGWDAQSDVLSTCYLFAPLSDWNLTPDAKGASETSPAQAWLAAIIRAVAEECGE